MYYIIARTYFHPSIKESTFRFSSPRLWHTLTGRIVRRKLPPTFAGVNIAVDARQGHPIFRFHAAKGGGEGRVQVGKNLEIFEISKGTKVSRESVNGFLCKLVEGSRERNFRN